MTGASSSSDTCRRHDRRIAQRRGNHRWGQEYIPEGTPITGGDGRIYPKGHQSQKAYLLQDAVQGSRDRRSLCAQYPPRRVRK
eukprot:9490248-Pyramimonas_sp.AAC.2